MLKIKIRLVFILLTRKHFITIFVLLAIKPMAPSVLPLNYTLSPRKHFKTYSWEGVGGRGEK
jgi:hypothetical protein